MVILLRRVPAFVIQIFIKFVSKGLKTGTDLFLKRNLPATAANIAEKTNVQTLRASFPPAVSGNRRFDIK